MNNNDLYTCEKCKIDYKPNDKRSRFCGKACQEQFRIDQINNRWANKKPFVQTKESRDRLQKLRLSGSFFGKSNSPIFYNQY